MKTVRLHTLGLRWHCADMERDPVEALLAWLPAGTDVEPDLTIRLSGLTGPIPAGPLGVESAVLLRHNEVRCISTPEGVCIRDGACELWIREAGKRLEGVVHEPSIKDNRAFSRVTLLIALATAMRYHGWFHLHAGAVTLATGHTVVIAGDGGAGKSTCTLALTDGCAKWISDDFVFLATEDGELRVYGLPRPFHLSEWTLSLFPHLVPTGPWIRNKSDWDPRTQFSGRRAGPGRTPFVLLFPEVSASDKTEIRQISKGEAYGRTLVSSPWVAGMHMPFRGEHETIQTRLVNEATTLEVSLGSDFVADPGVLKRRLDGFLAGH